MRIKREKTYKKSASLSKEYCQAYISEDGSGDTVRRESLYEK